MSQPIKFELPFVDFEGREIFRKEVHYPPMPSYFIEAIPKHKIVTSVKVEPQPIETIRHEFRVHQLTNGRFEARQRS